MNIPVRVLDQFFLKEPKNGAQRNEANIIGIIYNRINTINLIDKIVSGTFVVWLGTGKRFLTYIHKLWKPKMN